MISILKISSLVKGDIIGNKDLIVKGVCDIEIGKKSYITYVKNENYEKYLNKSKASAIIIDKDVSIKSVDKTFIVVKKVVLSGLFADLTLTKFANSFDFRAFSAFSHTLPRGATNKHTKVPLT